MTFPAAFVQGGLQDTCNDTCSICLENFCDDDPSTMTTCRHEYHLQCIMEWSQRSRECPICWQPLSLNDAYSQSVLTSSEQEKFWSQQRSEPFCGGQDHENEIKRFSRPYEGDSDMEDSLFQRLAFAAMGRSQQHGRTGDFLGIRPSQVQGHSHFMIVPPHPHTYSTRLGNKNATGTISPPASMSLTDGVGLGSITNQAQSGPSTTAFYGPGSEPVQRARPTDDQSLESYFPKQNTLACGEESQDGSSSSSSELSFSETFKSRLVAASSRYRESLSKTSRGFRERLRVRNSPMAELGARAREVSTGVVRALERMSVESSEKTRDSSWSQKSSASLGLQKGTLLFLSGGREKQKYSSSALEEKECADIMTSSSSTQSYPDRITARHNAEGTS